MVSKTFPSHPAKAHTLAELTPEESAELAGLTYVNDDEPGFTRKKCGTGYAYYNTRGQLIKNTATRRRINGLAIPPAYTHVWICPEAKGHLQATGINASGQKQYIYHAKWRDIRDDIKFSRMVTFGQHLPSIRKKVIHDLRHAAPLSRGQVLAAVVYLLDTTLIRVGNDEYARENDSYGLTTLRKKHVTLDKNHVEFEFEGKSGRTWEVMIDDPAVIQVIQACEETPGYELFKYMDDEGHRVDVKSTDVNDYLHALAGEGISAKSFRTWAGTVNAVEALLPLVNEPDKAQRKKHVVAAISEVSELLQNTPTICKDCYIHPHIIEAYLNQTLAMEGKSPRPSQYFSKTEALTLAILEDLYNDVV